MSHRLSAVSIPIAGVLLWPLAISPTLANSAALSDPTPPEHRFVELADDVPREAPLPRAEYVELLDQGLAAFIANGHATTTAIDQQCQALGDAVTDLQTQVEDFQTEANAVMAALRTIRRDKALTISPGLTHHPASLVSSDVQRLNDFRQFFEIDLRSPDGTFEGDRPLTRGEFVTYYNRLLNQFWRHATGFDWYESFLAQSEEQLDELRADLAIAQTQLVRLQALADTPATPPNAKHGSQLPVTAIAPTPSAEYPMSDFNATDPRYTNAAEFMQFYGLDVRDEGDRLAPDQSLTQAQFLDDGWEVALLLRQNFGNSVVTPMCDRFPLMEEDLLEITILQERVQAIEYDIRTWIQELQGMRSQ